MFDNLFSLRYRIKAPSATFSTNHKTKTKMASSLHFFSRALCRLRALALSSDWLFVSLASVVTGLGFTRSN